MYVWMIFITILLTSISSINKELSLRFRKLLTKPWHCREFLIHIKFFKHTKKGTYKWHDENIWDIVKYIISLWKETITAN